jgi:hypothetical protein
MAIEDQNGRLMERILVEWKYKTHDFPTKYQEGVGWYFPTLDKITSRGPTVCDAIYRTIMVENGRIFTRSDFILTCIDPRYMQTMNRESIIKELENDITEQEV